MKTLIVDRVTVFQEIITGLLNDSDIECTFATTGKEALEALAKEHFNCICMSLYLDDMDGFELSRNIRKIEQYRHTPIVLLTSKSSDDTLEQAISAGITDIFSKEKVHELVNFIARFTQINKPISGKILYIEDQNSQRDLVTSMFKSRNLEVDSFDNAEDAWQCFLKNRYHLVVTDIVLAGAISGVLLINKIRRLEGPKGDTPILVITGFDDSSRRISLYHMGITDYVTKPIIEEELIARVRNLIGNQKALEREIQFREHLNSEEALRRSMKLEALGKLTSGIAHDYNNMLNIITGYADLLKQNFLGESEVPSSELLLFVEQIEKASRNGINLTRKLLSFTRKDTTTSEVANINTLISESKPILDKLLTAAVRLNINLGNDLWNTYLDVHDFENALLNICINAKHAMGEKGALTINTANKNLSVTVGENIGLSAGDYVRLSILDTGCGMEHSTLSRIFDPFFSTKGDSGTGLGLSQVYGFVQRSQGAIKVESKPGKGTLFNIYFPRRDGEINNKVDTSNAIKKNAQRHKNLPVLVVDDEVSLAELTSEILKFTGYKVTTAYDANQALNLLKENDYSVLISDVIMPGMNGFELGEKVRKEYPNIKLILVSGYNDKFNTTEDMKTYCDQFLEKPVTSTQLIECIESIIK